MTTTLQHSGIFSRQSWHGSGWQALAAVAGLIVSLRMFYPGILSNDSLDQYSQALHFAFKDWHPPVMAFTWALINDWIPGPFGMLLLFCSLYWGGLFLLSLPIARTSKSCSILVVLLGFAPFAIGTLGNIWKDVFHAVFTLFAVGLLSIASRRGDRGHAMARTVALGLLLLGAMARFNAIAALPPLLWLAIGRPPLRNWKLPVLLAILPLSVMLFSSAFNYGFLRAERTGVVSSLLIFDIGAISQATGTNAFGQAFQPEDERKLTHDCYEPAAWDSYAWGRCAFLTRGLKDSGLWASGALFATWGRAVGDHPAAYVRHRFTHWWRLLWKPQNLLVSDMQSNELGLVFKKSALHLSLERVTDIMRGGIFFKPGFWLLLALAVIALTARRGAGPARAMAIALNVSGILYLFSYLPAGVATDFRYAYWSILAVWVSLPLSYASMKLARMHASSEAAAIAGVAAGMPGVSATRADSRQTVKH